MRKSNYERQKAWREKHRGLANLRRREAYAKRKSIEPAMEAISPKVQPKSKIEELRALIAKEAVKPPVSLPSKPMIFRNDYGTVITENQFNQLQERKRKAEASGYVIDEFSQ
jgi:hypothetical protein